jgi:4-amino-4-deoxy-L-arabinose transferase-like glycosyltransferase
MNDAPQNPMRPPPAFYRQPVFVVVVAAMAVRVWFLQVFAASPFFEPITNGNDRALYDTLAQKIAAGAWFPSGVFEYMPLYPWVLGTIYLIFGPNLYIAGAFGIFFDCGTTVLIYLLARSLGGSTSASITVSLLYALYPMAILYSVQIMPNTLNGLLILSYSYALHQVYVNGTPEVRSASSVRPMLAFSIGLLAGVTILGFPGMMLISSGAMGFLFLRDLRSGVNFTIPIIRTSIMVLGMMLPVAPVTLHNYSQDGGFTLITAHGGFNFYMGNHAGATGYPVQIKNFRGTAGSLLIDAKAETRSTLGREPTSSEFARHWSDKAWNSIKEDPWRAIKLTGLKFWKFVNHREYDDLRLLPMVQLSKLAFVSWWWPGLFWIMTFGLFGFLVANRAWLLRALIACGSMGIILFFITSRYRLALIPLIAVLAALGVDRLKRLLIERGGRTENHRRIAEAVMLGVCALVVISPLHIQDFKALDHYNTAAFLLHRGQSSEALKHSSEAVMLATDNQECWFVHANALFQERKHQQAEAAYRRSLELDPRHVSSHYNLALLLSHLGRRQEGLGHAQAALKIDPQHEGAARLLAESQPN